VVPLAPDEGNGAAAGWRCGLGSCWDRDRPVLLVNLLDFVDAVERGQS